MKLLISIRPEYCEKILTEEKLYEFRRCAPRLKISKILLYETAPVKQVVGSAHLVRILKDSPEQIWERCQLASGITKECFFRYFQGVATAYALELSNPIRYKKPVNPRIRYGCHVPQSFCYIM